MVQREPERYTVEQRKAARGDRIFIDTLRNAYGATAVVPYSVRAKPGAPVATPIRWEELERGADPQDWNMDNIGRRLGQVSDPWSEMSRHRYRVSAHRAALEALLDEEDR